MSEGRGESTVNKGEGRLIETGHLKGHKGGCVWGDLVDVCVLFLAEDSIRVSH